MGYQRILYEGAIHQVTEDTARDLIGRGLATPSGAVLDVPAVVVDVPGQLVTGFAELPADEAAQLDGMPAAECEPAMPARPKGRRR